MTLVWVGLPLWRGAVGIFYSPSRLGQGIFGINKRNISTTNSVT